MRSIREDEDFRRRIEDNRKYQNYLNSRWGTLASDAQARARIEEARAKRLEGQTAEKTSKISKTSKNILNESSAFKEEICLEAEFNEAPDEFCDAIRPVVKRGLRNKLSKGGRFVFEFLRKDIELPSGKVLLWQDTLIIRYQDLGNSNVSIIYLSYIPEWKLKKENAHMNYYLQANFSFEQGSEDTGLHSLTEGLENMEKFIGNL